MVAPSKAHCEGREAQTEASLGRWGSKPGTLEEGSRAQLTGLARARSSPFSCSSACLRASAIL